MFYFYILLICGLIFINARSFKYWYYWFLPQQFLYFFPLPHVVEDLVLLVYTILSILLVFLNLKNLYEKVYIVFIVLF